MSYCGAIPVDTEQSESRILVDACLARVREDAGLDDEPVLPPLHVLLGKPEPQTRLLVSPSARQLPSAEAIVRSAVKGPTPSARNAETTPSIDRTRSIARALRWPVFLCGFVGGIFGGVAFMKSPVGQKPVVQEAVQKAQDKLSSAYAASVAAKSRLVNVKR